MFLVSKTQQIVQNCHENQKKTSQKILKIPIVSFPTFILFFGANETIEIIGISPDQNF